VGYQRELLADKEKFLTGFTLSNHFIAILIWQGNRKVPIGYPYRMIGGLLKKTI
jgi:hypothetical protein